MKSSEIIARVREGVFTHSGPKAVTLDLCERVAIKVSGRACTGVRRAGRVSIKSEEIHSGKARGLKTLRIIHPGRLCIAKKASTTHTEPLLNFSTSSSVRSDTKIQNIQLGFQNATIREDKGKAFFIAR